MKKLFLYGLLLIVSFLQAQPRLHEKKEQIKALKIAFISTELKLTPEEAEKFWPLYNAYEDKKRENKQANWKRILENEETRLEGMSDKEAASLLAKVELAEESNYLEHKKFVQRLKDFLPAIKILQLKKAEEQFKRKLLKQVRNKKEQD